MKKFTYLKAIRKFCVECMGGSIQLPANYTSKLCKFYPYRLGKKPDIRPENTPLRSIRLYCLECVGTSNEVKNCSMSECPVYYYRSGKNPKLKSNNPNGNQKALENYRRNCLRQAISASNFNDNWQVNGFICKNIQL